MFLSGQSGIRVRHALVGGDPLAAALLVPALDRAHRIEVLLGAALRDQRHDFAAAHLFVATEASAHPDWLPLCRLLTEGEPETSLDDLASAYIAEGRVPDRYRAAGLPLNAPLRGPPYDLAVASALAAGVAGDALLDALPGALQPAVAWYYRRGTIHALGPRPLLILAASMGGSRYSGSA